MIKIPLHLQIMIALLLGAVFGVIFKTDHYALKVSYLDTQNKIETVKFANWDTLNFSMATKAEVFLKDEQIKIIKYFKKLSIADKNTLIINSITQNELDTHTQGNIVSIEKYGTLATFIRPIGNIFIRLLSFLAIPLVIATLILGAASLGDVKKLSRIGGKTFAIYVCTTAIAITIGLLTANIIEPGNQVDEASKSRLLGDYAQESSGQITDQLDVDLFDFLESIVPKNPIKAMSDGKMLQIVFFAVIFGITLTFIEKKKAEPIISFFEGVSAVMIKMVDFIMVIAPFGVFALIAATIADFGYEILFTLLWYILAVVIGLFIQNAVIYSSLVKYLGKMNIKKFFKGIRNAQAIGFSTSSSAATLPVTFDCIENNLGVPKQISGFVLPLGATINMDGTALYQGVAAIFIAQIYGLDLGFAEQITIVLTAVLASIGTAPVPGVGIIMLVMILQSVNIPSEGIALILGVDRILDMLRTTTNITGDAAVAVAIAGTEQKYLK